MKTTSLIDYAKTIKFGVRDFEKTSSRYLNYKTQKRNELDVSIDVRDIINSMDIFQRNNSWAYDLSKN